MKEEKSLKKSINKFLRYCLWFVFGLICGLFILQVYVHYSNQEETSSENVCLNLSLQETSECLRDYVSTFYKYNKTILDVNFTELKTNGGDCRDWAFLYERLAKERGFYSKTILITSDNISHRFAIMYNDEGYCLEDQLHNYDCFKY